MKVFVESCQTSTMFLVVIQLFKVCRLEVVLLSLSKIQIKVKVSWRRIEVKQDIFMKKNSNISGFVNKRCNLICLQSLLFICTNMHSGEK